MTEEDEAFDTLEKAIGWRKRQTEETIKLRDAFPRGPYDLPPSRDMVLEEVAREIEKMTAFGPDTISSFAVYIRNMKDAKTKTS